MKIFVDVDGTICKTEGNDYEHAIPIQENIDKINKLFDDGNEIYYWTSRGTTSGSDHRFLTKHQLLDWGCKHNHLYIGKLPFDLLIDDKTKRIEEI